MNKKILVAWFNFSVNGGIGRFINVANILDRFGYEVGFLSLTGNTNTDWQNFPGEILTYEQASTRTWDAVMVPGAGADDQTLSLLALLKIPRFGVRVQHILNDTSLYSRFALVNKLFAPHIVVTNNSHWQLKDFRKFSGDAFHFLPGAVDGDLFYPAPFKSFPIQSPEWVIGGFASKNPQPLLEALELLPDEYVLHLFGAVPPGLAGQFANWQQKGRLRFYGPLYGEDLRNFYQNIDIFVSTETRAGWCNSAAEAMACGVPSVVSQHGTIDFAENMGTALVLPELNSRAIAESIRRLTADPTLAGGIASRAAERMRSFSWVSYASQLLSIIYQPRVKSYFRMPEFGLYGKWDPQLRLSGLEILLENCRDSTVLDLGAAEGIVASQFARNGCRLIHGYELDAGRVDIARKILSQTPVKEFEFRTADLSSWEAFTSRQNGMLLDEYDIVLFLGLYHHLPQNERLNTLLSALRKAGSFFAIRTQRQLVEQDNLVTKIEAEGFQLIHEIEADPEENLGWMGVFRKVSPSPRTENGKPENLVHTEEE